MGYTPEQMEMALHQVHKDLKDMEHELKDVEHDIEHEIDERKGWMDYKKLYHKTSDSRYGKAAHDEFSHMLVALADAYADVRKHINTAEEQAEFDKFKTELLR
jgi:hypothetical protein